MKKNAMIFGDSYSTFEGFIPEGYSAYYVPAETEDSDVRDVSQTWWHQVVKEANLNLVMNNSWSGTTICYSGYTPGWAKETSFITRFRNMIEDGFFLRNEINKLFVFGGTNDSWSNAPLGEAKYEAWTEADLDYALPGASYFLNLVKETLPQAEIYCLINTELKPELSACMLEACEQYGIIPVHFDHIDLQCGHPTVLGMAEIKTAVLDAMKK